MGLLSSARERVMERKRWREDERNEEGSGRGGAQIDREKNLVCHCRILLILLLHFFLTLQSLSNGFHTGTIKHLSGKQGWRKYREQK